MGWPYTTSWYFENGAAEFGTETDGGNPVQGDFPHYTELARRKMTPFVGAYCYRIQLNGAAETAYIADTDVAMAAGETSYGAFALYLSDDFALGSSNTIDIFELLDGGVLQAAIRLLDVSGTLRFQVHNNTVAGPANEVTGTTYDVPIGKWMWVELLFTQSATVSLATLFVTVEGDKTATQVATTTVGDDTSPAVDSARLGVGINASTGNTGTLLFDAYHWHDPADANVGRINAPERRWSTTTHIHAPMHVFIGPGCLENLTMIGSDLVDDGWVVVYDTDRAQTDPDRIVGILSQTAANEVVDVSGLPIRCQNGCYVELYRLGAPTATGGYGTLVHGSAVVSTATHDAPRAIVTMSPIVYGSRARVIDHGLSRPPI